MNLKLIQRPRRDLSRMRVDLAAIVGEEDGKWMHLLITNGSHEVHKKRRLELTTNAMTALKLIRQAERYLACLEYGDKWKEHVGPYFSSYVTPEEWALVEQALGLIDKTSTALMLENEL